MRLLCRVGFHKWGRYSNEWYRIARITDFDGSWTEYRIFRTLQCQCCGMTKDKKTETLTGLGEKLTGKTYPIWD